jgi:hypothetical protein
LAAAQRAQGLAVRVLRPHRQGIEVRPVGVLDAKLAVEDEQGLAHGAAAPGKDLAFRSNHHEGAKDLLKELGIGRRQMRDHWSCPIPRW